MKFTARILPCIGLTVLLGALPALHGQVRSSANYAMVAETQDGGGDLASSTNYSLESSVEPITAGDSTTSTLLHEHGFLTTGVVVDTSPPVITLAGDAVMTLYAGTDTYSETGATATDLVDGSVAVVIGGDAVDATTPGTYLVTYDATDSEGFAAEQVTRTVYVTRPVYFVDADAPDGGDGSSWASAFNQLQDALDLTAPRTKQYYGNEQEVWVAAGTYYPDEGTGQSDGDRSSTFLVKTGITLYGGFAGTETALNQRDPDTNLTILSGDLDQNDTGVPGAGNAYHVVTMLDPATYTANKGEIDVDTGLDGFTITGGKADGTAPHDTGGGVLVTGTEADDGTIRDCRILGNAAKNGAGVAMAGPSWLIITSSEIRENHAELDGGGIYAREASGRTRIGVSRLESNTATRGGGLYFNSADDTLNAIVEFCHVRGNHASDTGGGIHVGLGYVRFDTCLISGNAAGGNGGGIFGEEADLELEFSTLAGNRAGGQGGALYGETPGALSCAKTLIWGNEDASGAGAPGGSIAGGVTGSASFTTSLVEGFAPGGGNLDGTLAANDPAFVAPEAPANAPTVSGDYHLTAASPVTGLAPGSGLDLDFVARGAAADLGAYEYVAAVLGRHIFYNQSAWDNNDAEANADDDNAIAPDKSALLPGQLATFANYSSYSRGINGIMVDIADLAGTPTVADFEFKVGNDQDPSGWTAAPTPTVTVREAAGESGSDRVTITWGNNAIHKCWLQVTVKATANTGLVEDDVHYWGNAIGDTCNRATDAAVNASDEIKVRANGRTSANLAPIDDLYDINRDRVVNATDEIKARANGTTSSTMLVLLDLSNQAGAVNSITRSGALMQNAAARVARSTGSRTSDEMDASAEANVSLSAPAKRIEAPMTMHRMEGGGIVLEFTVPEGAILQSSEDMELWQTIDVESEPGAWREGEEAIMVKASGASRFFRVMIPDPAK